MALSAFKLPITSTSTNKCINSLFFRYSVVSNRYFCSKNDNETKDPESGSSAEKASKENLKEPAPAKSKELSSKLSKPASLSEDSKEAAKKRLEALLSDIKVESSVSQKSGSRFSLARPLKRPSKAERFPRVEKISPEQELKLAVKAVASTFKEDSDKIETELNTKLNSIGSSHDDEYIEEDSAEEKSDHLINTEMSKKIMSSVKNVASDVSEIPAAPKSKLIQKLMKLPKEDAVSSTKESMFHLVESMKVQARKEVKQRGISDDTMMPRRPRTAPSRLPVQKIDLFGSSPLDIFTPSTRIEPEIKKTIWQTLQEKELKLLVQFAPTSAFEEMIMWTEEGKHWKFPIDNEIDMGPEENVGFHEHVFLEKHLKEFPTKGPIRHFMELVVVGLSKNPYITVDRKIENINWFKDYFKEKEELLRDCGAIE